MISKKILVAISLDLLGNILCPPLWTECDYGGFVRSFFDKKLDSTYCTPVGLPMLNPFNIKQSSSLSMLLGCTSQGQMFTEPNSA